MSSAPSHFASLLPLEECLGGRRNLYLGSVDTAPSSRKTFVLWRPPIVAEWFTPSSEGAKKAAVSARGAGGRVGPAAAATGGGQEGEGEQAVSDAASRSRGGEGGGGRWRGGRGRGGGRGGSSGSGSAGGGGAEAPSLSGLDGWRKGPSDNFYNKEYLKLMGAALPRPSSQPSSSSSSPSVRGTGASASGVPAKEGGVEDSGDEESNGGDCGGGGRGAATGKAAVAAAAKERTRGTKKRGRGEQRAGAAGEASTESAALLEAGIVGDTAAVAAVVGDSSNGGSGGDAGTPGSKRRTPGSEAAGGEGEGGGEGGGGAEWEDGRRRSPICETAQILAALVKQRVKTLAFCRTRKLTELTLRYGHQVCAPQCPMYIQACCLVADLFLLCTSSMNHMARFPCTHAHR